VETPGTISKRLVVMAVIVALVLMAVFGLLIVEAQQRVAAAERMATDRLAVQNAWAAEKRELAAEAARQDQAAKAAARRRVAYEKAAEREAARAEAAREEAAGQATEAAAQAGAEAEAVAEVEGRQAAAEPAAVGQVVTGDFTVPDINGALVTQVGGYPGQPLSSLSGRQLDRMGAMLTSLERGETFPCPEGAGGGYSDIAAGGQVVVKDGAGRVLATTELSGGQVNTRGCTFDFQLEVPDTDFYQVEVTHRGALTFARSDLAANEWHVSARL
jgi:hypothetical protein